jgi:hypothetical protein
MAKLLPIGLARQIPRPIAPAELIEAALQIQLKLSFERIQIQTNLLLDVSENLFLSPTFLSSLFAIA